MTGLALIDTPPAQWVTELARWEQLLTDANRIEAAEAIDRARLIREIVKIRKLSADLTTAATRVEAHALRRLGQIEGGPDGLSPGPRISARYLAAMPADEFARFVETITAKTAIGTLVNGLRNRDQARELREEADERARHNRWKSVDHSITVRDTRVATRALIHQVFVENEATSTAAAAAKLLAALNVWEDDTTSQAAEAVVEQALAGYAIRLENADDADRIGLQNVPEFVVVNTDEGWVRLPRHRATVAQLRWAATHRREQADEAAADATFLEWHADRVEEICAELGLPHDTPLGDAHFANEEGQRAARYRGIPKAEAARAALKRRT